MAAAVGNLYRRLGEFACHKPHPRIIVHLRDIQKLLDSLLRFLSDAEWKRYLHYADWRRDHQVYDGERKVETYGKISKWVSRVAALATEVEEIIVAYDLHLCNMNTGSLYNKLRYFPFFITSFESVYAKIQRFLSKFPKSSSTSKVYPYHPMESSSLNLSTLEDDRIPLLQNPESTYSDSITDWTKGFLGIEMLELLQRFSRTVLEEIRKLNWDATDMQIVSQTTGDIVSKRELGKTVQTILESVTLIGRQMEEHELESWLQAEVKEESSPPMVIGVTGEPGIGKTTLAAAIYDRVKLNFDCHAWIFVPPNPNSMHVLRDILKGILQSMSVMVPNKIDSVDEATLTDMIHQQLTGRSFLLVLDDVPTVLLNFVKLVALPRACKAKIICTSQKGSPDYRHVLDLQRLTPQNAFNLLRKRACLGVDGSQLWSSVQCERDDILSVCGGLPLAIATVGGMLSTKQMKSQEWNSVHCKLKEAQYVPLSFIPLSYADLSPVLKSCFLFAASFPSQFEISCKKLQRLWIAEGFVQTEANLTPEEVAKLQLEELIQRNMIQVARVGMDGGVETCRVVGPMREYALTRCQQDQYFFTIIDGTGDNAYTERPHRLFVHSATSSRMAQDDIDKLNFGGLYSFLAIFKLKVPRPLFSTSKLLSVLELQELPDDTLPNAIGDLVLLRYLSLRGTKLKKLPLSLNKLHRLETLDIRDTFVKDLPASLESLAMLRHLLLAGSYSDTVVNLKVEVELLKNLQTLAGFKLTNGISKGLTHLPQLQKLSLGEVQSVHSVNLFESIDQMKLLRSFTVKCVREKEKIDLISCNPHDNLVKLRFGGPARNLLHWVSKLHALEYLYLWDNNLTDDPFLFLHNLPNLVVLSLCNAYDGENIQFGSRGFLKLKKLSLLHCRNLKQWTEINNRTMGNLQMLTIAYCPKLSGLPKGLDKLCSLQALQVSNMPEDFINQAREIQLRSKFSLHVRDTTNPSAAVKQSITAKRLPMFMPPHRNIKMQGTQPSSSRPNLQAKKKT